MDEKRSEWGGHLAEVEMQGQQTLKSYVLLQQLPMT